MKNLSRIDPGWGITIVRIMMAVIFIVSGFKKWQAGMGATAAFFTKVGIPLPGVAAPLVGTLEVVGGILLLLGIASRLFGLLFAIEMIVTAFYVKFPAQWFDPARIDLMLLAAGTMVVIAGPGRLAVDNLWIEREREAVPGARVRAA